MSRISRLDRSEVTTEMAARCDKALAQRGNVPNTFRVMAHRPEIFATMQAHFAAVIVRGGALHRHGLDTLEGVDHRSHQPGERHALLPGRPHHPGPETGMDR